MTIVIVIMLLMLINLILIIQYILERRRADFLAEGIDFMRTRYSNVGGRECFLCTYKNGNLIKPCRLHDSQERP